MLFSILDRTGMIVCYAAKSFNGIFISSGNPWIRTGFNSHWRKEPTA